MNSIEPKPTLDRPATFEIQVPGELDEGWSDWNGAMTITVECEGDGPPVTTLTGTLDQAGLQGLLRRLYALGLPLISVKCLQLESHPPADGDARGRMRE